MELRESLPGGREVHVWSVELEASATSAEAYSRSLSADETQRASRFRFEHLKRDFTFSRGVLRALLGRYLGTEPSRIRFAYGPRGKPRVAFPETALEFNLAHSGRFASYAFAVGCELGLDIEEVKPISDQEGIVRQFFSPEECAEWLELNPAQRDEAFFRCWTSKEAYIKALGDGLSMPLDSFRVSLRPEVPAMLIHAAGDPDAASRWTMRALSPADGYSGTLAVSELDRSICILPRLTAEAVLQLVSGSDLFPPAELVDNAARSVSSPL